MIDIRFYMKAARLKQELVAGANYTKQALFEKLESFRSRYPLVYNIETTNACNMRCEMCPRTTMMTRSITSLDMPAFKHIVTQIRPHSLSDLAAWETFVEDYYGVSKADMSENHFFLYIIFKVLVLHGYGDPLLDKDMPERIRLLSEKKIPSYFSCNPANIDIEKTVAMFENGLDYIKYSIESVDDLRHKQIRGSASNFTDSYRKILKLVDLKAQKGYNTTIVITMLNLNKKRQVEEFQKLQDAFAGLDVYLYLKSQDQQWYQDKQEGTQSIHWLEFCQFPWSSMTIKSNGETTMCVEDFNNEIILGDARQDALKEIWNNDRYRTLRGDHLNLTPGIKCTEQCDMKLIGSFLNRNGERIPRGLPRG